MFVMTYVLILSLLLMIAGIAFLCAALVNFTLNVINCKEKKDFAFILKNFRHATWLKFSLFGFTLIIISMLITALGIQL